VNTAAMVRFDPVSGKDVKDDCLTEKIINDVKIKKSIKYM
jgi:predicted HAD superfamily Cof-like phosphohydrolase